MAKTPVKKTSAKKTAVKSPAKKATGTKSSSRPVKKAVRTMDEDLVLALALAQGMYEKKALDIRILDMRAVRGASSNYFVISHATNDKQVEAIANSAEEEAKKLTKETPWHREGFENLQWVLLDFINVVAHIFLEEKREFYGVEELWADAAEVTFKGK